MKIELNKTYHFDMTGDFKFGTLNEEETNEIMKDGRVASHFLERQLTKWYPSLTFVDKTGYDHIDDKGNKYDAKNFTKGGLRFQPSNMIGQGRVFDQTVATAKAEGLIYICCDIVDYPKVRVKFVKGSELVKKYPKCTIPKSKRSELFQ